MLQVRQHSAETGASSSGPPGSAPRGRPEWRHGDLPRNLPNHRLPGREPFQVCVEEWTVRLSVSTCNTYRTQPISFQQLKKHHTECGAAIEIKNWFEQQALLASFMLLFFLASVVYINFKLLTHFID